MIIHPDLLVNPASQAGMKVPPDPVQFDTEEYPHFTVYCTMQLGAPLSSPTDHWENAKVIASIPDEQIKTVTPKELMERGFRVGYPMV